MTISESLRKRIIEQAQNRCGYCLVSAQFIYAPMEIDHLIPTAKGGKDTEDNLWLACPRCNNHKSDLLDVVDPVTSITVRLFDPRTQIWSEHFEWSKDDLAKIVGKSAVGRATVDTLKLNSNDNLQFRRLLVSIKHYPPFL
ncbi:MAG: HNH endonuclease signature motif containing protein [Aggregatilineales bacterium]